jgi:hypothetical protein
MIFTFSHLRILQPLGARSIGCKLTHPQEKNPMTTATEPRIYPVWARQQAERYVADSFVPVDDDTFSPVMAQTAQDALVGMAALLAEMSKLTGLQMAVREEFIRGALQNAESLMANVALTMNPDCEG